MLRRSIPWMLLAIALTGCRAPLCIREVRATCECADPNLPDVKTCVAYAEVVSCNFDLGADPCRTAPCCKVRRDGGTDGSVDGGSGDARDM